MKHVITWREALESLLSSVESIGTENVPLRHGFSCRIAEAIPCHTPNPPYHVAICEGYAVNTSFVAEKLKAGDGLAQLRYRGQISPSVLKDKYEHRESAYAVSDGDFIPEWLDAVILASDAKLQGSSLLVSETPQKLGGILPAGSFVPADEELIKEDDVIEGVELAILFSQLPHAVRIYKRPAVGVLLHTAGLVGHSVETPRKNTMREILTPMFGGFMKKLGVPFVTMSVHGGELSELIPEMLAKVDVLILSGFFSDSKWEEVISATRHDMKLTVPSLPHPLGEKFLGAISNKGERKWLFAFYYHPVFAVALYALLIKPFLEAFSSTAKLVSVLEDGVISEGMTVDGPRDNLWIGLMNGLEKGTGLVRVKPLAPISTANLKTVSRGNCTFLTSDLMSELRVGERVSIGSY